MKKGLLLTILNIKPGNGDTHPRRGHYLNSLFPVQVFNSLGEGGRVSVGQVRQRFIAGLIQLLCSRLQKENYVFFKMTGM